MFAHSTPSHYAIQLVPAITASHLAAAFVDVKVTQHPVAVYPQDSTWHVREAEREPGHESKLRKRMDTRHLNEHHKQWRQASGHEEAAAHMHRGLLSKDRRAEQRTVNCIHTNMRESGNGVS